jgi:hypothetical protein
MEENEVDIGYDVVEREEEEISPESEVEKSGQKWEATSCLQLLLCLFVDEVHDAIPTNSDGIWKERVKSRLSDPTMEC